MAYAKVINDQTVGGAEEDIIVKMMEDLSVVTQIDSDDALSNIAEALESILLFVGPLEMSESRMWLYISSLAICMFVKTDGRWPNEDTVAAAMATSVWVLVRCEALKTQELREMTKRALLEWPNIFCHSDRNAFARLLVFGLETFFFPTSTMRSDAGKRAYQKLIDDVLEAFEGTGNRVRWVMQDAMATINDEAN